MSKKETKVLIGELERIKTKYGKLTPEIMVKEATSPRNPLHKYFEWDDTVAAHQYRLQQSRVMIGWIHEEVAGADGETITRRSYLSCNDSLLGKVYMHTSEILNNKDLADQKIREAWNNICYWKKYLSGFKIFC